MEAKHPNLHEWLRAGAALAAAFAALATPIVAAKIAANYADKSAKRTIRAQYVQLAAQVLEAGATNANRPLREWAITVLDSFAEVKLNDVLKQELRDSLSLGLRSFPCPRGFTCSGGLIFASDSALREAERGWVQVGPIGPHDTGAEVPPLPPPRRK